jgi:pimeloyl-ACP methyl ester carboxylesterase
MSTAASPPAWFTHAIQTPALSRTVQVRGASIHYRVWNPEARRVVLFVHGAAANARWWDHIAPFVARGLRAVAIDLSGHGQSGWRDDYAMADWAHEIAGVIDAENADGRCVVVAHSMGGMAAVQTLYLGLKVFDGLIILDSLLRARSDEELRERATRGDRPNRIFANRADALRAYRTRPPQNTNLPYVRAHVAEHSLREAEGGWTWQFDTAIYRRLDMPGGFKPLPCRGVFVRAEHGAVPPDVQRQIVERSEGTLTTFDIPDAYSQGFGTRRVCAGLIQHGLVAIDGEVVLDAALNVQTQGLRFTVQGQPWDYHAPAYRHAAQARGHRVLAKTVHLAQHLHPVARAAAPAAAKGRGAGRAGRGPAGPGHHRPAAADRRRQVHPPHEFAQAPCAQGLRGDGQAPAGRRARCSACCRAWCWTTTPRPWPLRPPARPWQMSTADAPDADRGQIPPGQAHGGGGGQPGRGACTARAWAAWTGCQPTWRRASGAG